MYNDNFSNFQKKKCDPNLLKLTLYMRNHNPFCTFIKEQTHTMKQLTPY